MHRLQMLDGHVASKHAAVKKLAPTLNVWESMGLDSKLTSKAVEMRKATAKLMDENIVELNKHVDSTNFPFFLVEKSK